MIELCNKRRMLITVGLLGGLTVLVLILESHWASQSNNLLVTNTSKAADCWEREKFEILEACHPCSNFEIASQSVEACFNTKFKEVIKCAISGNAQRSCEKVAWIEEKKFWIFEVSMFAVAVLSGSLVYVRQHILDRRVKSRIQKQLASGLAN